MGETFSMLQNNWLSFLFFKQPILTPRKFNPVKNPCPKDPYWAVGGTKWWTSYNGADKGKDHPPRFAAFTPDLVLENSTALYSQEKEVSGGRRILLTLLIQLFIHSFPLIDGPRPAGWTIGGLGGFLITPGWSPIWISLYTPHRKDYPSELLDSPLPQWITWFALLGFASREELLITRILLGRGQFITWITLLYGWNRISFHIESE